MESPIEFTCESCGTTLSFPASEAGSIQVCRECLEYVDVPDRTAHPSRGDAPLPEPPAETPLTFEWVDDLPRPCWDQFSQWISESVPEDDWNDAIVRAARYWLSTLANALPPGYEVSESDRFHLLCRRGRTDCGRMLAFCEQALETITAILPSLQSSDAGAIGYGKHVVLAFGDSETYYTYASHFYPEGESGGSSGLFLDGYYRHIALMVGPDYERTIAHELTHLCLSDLQLPPWLNEGMALVAEDLVAPRSLDWHTSEMAARQKRHWSEKGLERFWSATAFFAPDEEQELAYALAEILVRQLLADFPRQFPEFVLAAQVEDAGAEAAERLLKCDLAQRASLYLGSGDWKPRGPYRSE